MQTESNDVRKTKRNPCSGGEHTERGTQIFRVPPTVTDCNVRTREKRIGAQVAVRWGGAQLELLQIAPKLSSGVCGSTLIVKLAPLICDGATDAYFLRIM